MTPGGFFYVIGPSGAGKDSVIAWARAASDPGRIAFAHRYITRPVLADAENHIALSAAEFAARRRAGWFALDWQSHGLSYGIGREIDSWRADGIAVVVNGSRIHLAEAAARYPEIRPVLITAPEEIRRVRLRKRNREVGQALAERLEEGAEVAHPRLVRIENGGPLAQAGEAFAALLCGSDD
jgi:ribose 1,5-bisphosphokinase